MENLLKIGLAKVIVPYTKGLLKCTLEIENRIRRDTLALRPSPAERRPHGQNVSFNLIFCFLVGILTLLTPSQPLCLSAHVLVWHCSAPFPQQGAHKTKGYFPLVIISRHFISSPNKSPPKPTTCFSVNWLLVVCTKAPIHQDSLLFSPGKGLYFWVLGTKTPGSPNYVVWNAEFSISEDNSVVNTCDTETSIYLYAIISVY